MLTVVSFNARHGRPQKGFASNRLLEAAVASWNADIVGLQEVERHVVRSWFRDQPAAIARAARMTYEYEPVRRVALTGDDGIALLVRGEIVHCKKITLPRADREQRRAAIIARVRVAGNEVTVATTHLHSGAHELAERQLEALVEALDSEPEPHILLGDLNLDPRRVAPHLSSGLVLADGAPTFPAHSPVRRIDHVAVRGMRIGSVTVPRQAVSDHCALIAGLDCAGTGPGG